MNDKSTCFLDSNLLIYAHTTLDQSKQQRIQQLIAEEYTFISTQVLKETANVLFRKFRFPWMTIQQVLQEMQQNNQVYTNTAMTIQLACGIAQRYQFSFYDSLIIGSALEAGCITLYSEDMQHEQVIEKRLTIRNPFL